MDSYVLNALPQDEDLILLTDKDTKISFLRDLTLYSKTAKQEKNLLYKGIINTNTECDVIGYKLKEG